MSVHLQMADKIAKAKTGKILFPIDFRGIGSDTAIKMSLSRFAKEGTLLRLSQGIYIKPPGDKKKHQLPTAEELAKAIAEKEKIRILPSGSYALYKLGFIEKHPDTLTFVTDGEPHKAQINNTLIYFKSTTPRKLSMKGEFSGLITQALEEIGAVNVTTDHINKIRETLKKEDQSTLLEDIKKAPSWIYHLITKILKQLSNESAN